MDAWPCNRIGSGFGDSAAEVSSHPVNKNSHAVVETYFRNIDLGDGALRVMLPAWEWKRRQLEDGVHEPRRERIRHERDGDPTVASQEYHHIVFRELKPV